jgi:hypothetical protein
VGTERVELIAYIEELVAKLELRSDKEAKLTEAAI